MNYTITGLELNATADVGHALYRAQEALKLTPTRVNPELHAALREAITLAQSIQQRIYDLHSRPPSA
jgi:hypothetical protein